MGAGSIETVREYIRNIISHTQHHHHLELKSGSGDGRRRISVSVSAPGESRRGSAHSRHYVHVDQYGFVFALRCVRLDKCLCMMMMKFKTAESYKPEPFRTAPLPPRPAPLGIMLPRCKPELATCPGICKSSPASCSRSPGIILCTYV